MALYGDCPVNWNAAFSSDIREWSMRRRHYEGDTDWGQFCCLVIWTGFMPAEFKRLNPFQPSILTWTWKLSFSFCCISPQADQFLTSEKRYVNHSVFDLLGDLYVLTIVQTWTWREQWPGKSHDEKQNTKNRNQNKAKFSSFVYVSIHHFL